MSILLFILILTFLILIHELGHFFTALYFKVRVLEFGLGIPPMVKTLFTWRGIPFTLNALPLGGFVRMDGEDGSAEPSADSKKQTAKSIKREYALYEKPAWQRLIIILAGATINFVFGVLVFAGIFSVIGIPKLTTVERPIIAGVTNDSPAQKAGVQENDEIITVVDANGNAHEAKRHEDLIAWLKERGGQEVTMVINRGGEEKQFTMRLRTQDEIGPGDGALGIAPVNQKEEFVRYPWYQMPFRGMVVGVQHSVAFGKLILTSLNTMLTDLLTRGVIPKDVSGPVGIAAEVQRQDLFSRGPLVILNFAAMLSVNLAIMNVLPIPALDGGRALFIFVEKIIGKKALSKVEGSINTAGFVFLIGLLLLITLKDVLAML